MRFEGSFRVRVPRQRVWEFLTNPTSFAASTPDLEDFRVTPEGFDVKYRTGISFVKGTFHVRARYVEKRAPEYAKILAHGSGLQGSVDLATIFELEDHGSETDVKWQAHAALGGMLAGIGSRLLASATRKHIEQLVHALKEKLEA